MPGADDDFIDPAHGRFARAAEPARHARQTLHLEGHVLEDVARPGALAQPLQEPAALADAAAMLDQGGQPDAQALGETGDGVGGAVLEVADIDQRLDDGPIGPDIRPAQMHHIDEINIFPVHPGTLRKEDLTIVRPARSASRILSRVARIS